MLTGTRPLRTIGVAMLFSVAMLAGACGGHSEEPQSTAPAAAAPVVQPTATPPPAPPTVVEAAEPITFTNEQRINAALDDLATNELPVDLIAYDIIDTSTSSGLVNIEVCGWTGETVFDDVYLIRYRVPETPNDGQTEPQATLESANTTAEDCTNTTLIETALQATRDYDNYWSTVIEDPASYDEAEAAETLSPEFRDFVRDTIAEWIDQGQSYQNTYFDAGLPSTAIQPILFRSYEQDGFDVFELMTCRELPVDFGLYQGSVLIDDFREGSAGGRHATAQYFFTNQETEWSGLGVIERVWADCFGFNEEGWLAGINRILPDPVPWESLDT